jgi:hypothetical protein
LYWHHPSSRTGVDLASNRNEYWEYFLGSKGGQCVGLTTLQPSCADCLDILVASTSWSPKGQSTPVQGLLINIETLKCNVFCFVLSNDLDRGHWIYVASYGGFFFMRGFTSCEVLQRTLYIISYHIIYHITSYIVSYPTISYTTSYHISYHIIYQIIYRITLYIYHCIITCGIILHILYHIIYHKFIV